MTITEKKTDQANTHTQKKKIHKNVPEFPDPQEPQEHTHTDVQNLAHDATTLTTTLKPTAP